MEVTAVRGDIAAQDVEAVVSAASTALRMGSGVAGSLLDAAGEDLAAALGRADQLGCRSLAIPPLGCGHGGVHPQDGTRVVAETVAGYDPETVETVRLVAVGRFEAGLFERALDR